MRIKLKKNKKEKKNERKKRTNKSYLNKIQAFSQQQQQYK